MWMTPYLIELSSVQGGEFGKLGLRGRGVDHANDSLRSIPYRQKRKNNTYHFTPGVFSRGRWRNLHVPGVPASRGMVPPAPFSPPARPAPPPSPPPLGGGGVRGGGVLLKSSTGLQYSPFDTVECATPPWSPSAFGGEGLRRLSNDKLSEA